MEQINSTVMKFSKEQDVRNTADLLHEYIGENVQDPGQHSPRGSMTEGKEAF